MRSARAPSYRVAAVEPPAGEGALEALRTATGEAIRAGAFVFACGPWLGKLFPERSAAASFRRARRSSSSARRRATRASRRPRCRPGSISARDSTACPTSRAAASRSRTTSTARPSTPTPASACRRADALAEARAFLAQRFPALARRAARRESRVCQYENTSNGDFVDRPPPGFDNVWLVRRRLRPRLQARPGGGRVHGRARAEGRRDRPALHARVEADRAEAQRPLGWRGLLLTTAVGPPYTRRGVFSSQLLDGSRVCGSGNSLMAKAFPPRRPPGSRDFGCMAAFLLSLQCSTGSGFDWWPIGAKESKRSC